MPSGFYIGDSGAEGGIGGIVGVETGDIGTPNTLTETTLHSITLPANSLPAVAGHALVRARAWGTCANNARDKLASLYWGASFLVGIETKDLTADFPNGTIWELTVDITGDRVNQAVRAHSEIIDPGGGEKTIVAAGIGTVTEDGAAPILIKVTGKNGYLSYEDEAHTIPDIPGPYTITVDHAPNIVDIHVTIDGTGATKVVGSPAAGQYSVNQTTGVYTFNVADKTKTAAITYNVVTTVTNDIVCSGLTVEYLSSAD